MMQRKLLLILVAGSIGIAVAACGSKSKQSHGDDHNEHGEDKHAGEDDEHAGEHDEHEEGVVVLTVEAAARVRIRTSPVEERALAGIISTTGRVDFDRDRLAHVSPRVPGRVHRVNATLGQKVRKGQNLATIDSISLGQSKSAFLQAKAQLALASTTLEREKGLLEDKITSQQSLLEAQATHQRALAGFQSARQQLRLLGLSKKQIASVSYEDSAAALFPLLSPIAGTVVEKHASLGEVVSPDRNLYTIADLSRLWIWIDIYERDLARVHLEDDVAVKVDAFSNKIFEGKVAYIRDQVDPDTRTARARIDVANPDGFLRAGMFAKVVVSDPHGVDGEALRKSIVVPVGAVQRDGKQHIAFVPDGERRYERRVLTLGRRTDAFIEILSGLAADETVVVEGTFLLKSEVAKESMGGGHSH